MSKPNGNRRFARFSFYALMVGGIVLLAAWSWGVFDLQYEFRKESHAVLLDLTGGADTATSAYDEACFLFQEASLLTSFVDRADRLTQVLGKYVEIQSVDEVETMDTIRGKTARVRYSVRFENVTTGVELSYLLSDSAKRSETRWKLLGFNISVPSRMAGKVELIDSEYDRIKAPAEVVLLVDETLRAIDEGRGAEIRAKASPPFQESTTEERFATTLRRYRKELGPFKRRLRIHSSGQNAAKDRARVHVLLQFEKAKTSGNFEFIKREGQWRLLHLKILIPEAFFPQ